MTDTDIQQHRQQSLKFWEALFAVMILVAGFILGTFLGLRHRPHAHDNSPHE